MLSHILVVFSYRYVQKSSKVLQINLAERKSEGEPPKKDKNKGFILWRNAEESLNKKEDNSLLCSWVSDSAEESLQQQPLWELGDLRELAGWFLLPLSQQLEGESSASRSVCLAWVHDVYFNYKGIPGLLQSWQGMY